MNRLSRLYVRLDDWCNCAPWWVGYCVLIVTVAGLYLLGCMIAACDITPLPRPPR